MGSTEKDFRIFKFYMTLMTIICIACAGFTFKTLRHQKFQEIDVERINIVEKDGKLKMVISNQERQHPGMMDGITFNERKGQRPAGLIFFGENGNEIGGLVFEGIKGKDQGGSLTFDKYRGDQTIQFLNDEDEKGSYFAGLKMNDQNMPSTDLSKKVKEIESLPTKEAKDSAYQALQDQGLPSVERLKIGKDFDKSSIIKMRDAKGKTRIELKVEANGNAELNFLDEVGKVVYSLPEDARTKAKK